MTYNTFPTTVIPSYGYKSGLDYKTLLFESASGNVEQARYERRFPKNNFGNVFQNITPEEADVLKKFVGGQLGSATPFWYIDWEEREWTDIYVGRGTGALATFDLHGFNITENTVKIYVAGHEQIVTDEYVFVHGGGDAGADRITFGSGHLPEVGTLITSDFTGKLRIKGRFKDDGYQESYDRYRMVTISIAIYEVQW